MPDLPGAVVTDTVGFIRKLPHQVIEAFKATLEESAEADILIHVSDISHPHWKAQLEVVRKLTIELGWTKKPMIYVFNKVDVASPERRFQVKDSPRVFVSAATGEGIDQLKAELVMLMSKALDQFELYFTNQQRYLIFDLAREAQISKQEEGPTGVVVSALMTPATLSKWSQYLTNKQVVS